jgi:hypothetical protein
MDATCSSETSVEFQRTTRLYITEDVTVHNYRCENLKSYNSSGDSQSQFQNIRLAFWTERASLLRLSVAGASDRAIYWEGRRFCYLVCIRLHHKFLFLLTLFLALCPPPRPPRCNPFCTHKATLYLGLRCFWREPSRAQQIYCCCSCFYGAKGKQWRVHISLRGISTCAHTARCLLSQWSLG